MFFGVQHSNYTFNYYTEPNKRSSLAYKNQRCYWPRGKIIGGSGAINGMLYVRGNDNDFDNWGYEGWMYKDVEPYFERSVKVDSDRGYLMLSNHSTGCMNEHGFRKPESSPVMQFFPDIILAAADELGLRHLDNFGPGQYIGYSFLKTTIQFGRRASPGKSYLARVADRPNLKVIKYAQVIKLNFNAKGDAVQSVTFLLRNRSKFTIKARKEIILSAGAIDTPKILWLSGVGPRPEMKRHSLPVIHDLPIGENLQDHLLVPIFLRVPQNKDLGPITSQQTLNQIYEYLTGNCGYLSSIGTTTLTGFISTKGGRYPDIEFHHFTMQSQDYDSLDIYLKGISLKEEYGDFLRAILSENHLHIMYVILLNPKSIGHLKPMSGDYRDPPIIDANYFDHSDDVETVLRGIQFVERMEKTKSFQRHQFEILKMPVTECNAFEFKTLDYWKCYSKYFSTTLYHPVGTVKMARNATDGGCVNTRLKLHNVENLRVVDASIMPTIPSGNTNAPAVMVAERASDLIQEDWANSD